MVKFTPSERTKVELELCIRALKPHLLSTVAWDYWREVVPELFPGEVYDTLVRLHDQIGKDLNSQDLVIAYELFLRIRLHVPEIAKIRMEELKDEYLKKKFHDAGINKCLLAAETFTNLTKGQLSRLRTDALVTVGAHISNMPQGTDTPEELQNNTNLVTLREFLANEANNA